MGWLQLIYSTFPWYLWNWTAWESMMMPRKYLVLVFSSFSVSFTLFNHYCMEGIRQRQDLEQSVQVLQYKHRTLKSSWLTGFIDSTSLNKLVHQSLIRQVVIKFYQTNKYLTNDRTFFKILHFHKNVSVTPISIFISVSYESLAPLCNALHIFLTSERSLACFLPEEQIPSRFASWWASSTKSKPVALPAVVTIMKGWRFVSSCLHVCVGECSKKTLWVLSKSRKAV